MQTRVPKEQAAQRASKLADRSKGPTQGPRPGGKLPGLGSSGMDLGGGRGTKVSGPVPEAGGTNSPSGTAQCACGSRFKAPRNAAGM